MRRIFSLVVTGALVIVLSACSSNADTSSRHQGGCSAPQAGAISKSVKVSGAFGSAPSVSFHSPLTLSDTQRSIVITGTGTKSAAGDLVQAGLTAYNGKTGKQVASPEGYDSTDTGIALQLDSTRFLPGFVDALKCLAPGSRAVVTATAEGAFSSAYSQLGLSANDPIVLVADLFRILPLKATGTPVAPVAGLPTVKLAANGAPTVTIPKTAAPTETRIATLTKGSGTTVLPTSNVIIQYSGVLWRNGKVFDSTWSRGAPYSGQVSSFVPGFTKALEGQTVGSQVLAIIPPADGYGSQGSGEITGTDTMVFVIDILAVNG